MGGEEDPQKLKRIAAAAYDYDGDSRWADYWSNVLIPPNARPEVLVDHFKRKFYQRYIDPELVVEPMSTSSSSQPARPAGTQTYVSSSSTSNAQPRARSAAPAGSTPRTPGAANAPPPSADVATSPWDPRTIQFAVNAWVLVVGVLAILPLIPRNLSIRAFRLAFLGTACSSIYSLYSVYGKPSGWELQAIQMWFQSVFVTRDFVSFIYCLTFGTSNLYLKFALIPVLCRALEHVAKFLRRNFSRSSLYSNYLDNACVWVESNTTTLNILSSHAEIGNGFLLILAILSWQRNIIQAFIYWQLLKLMYFAPATANYHQSAWAKIGSTVNPHIQRYAPFLSTPIAAIQRWWFRR